jgi:hypothetical protein
MPCDSVQKKKPQTLTERRADVVKAMARLDRLVMTRKVRVVVGPQGAVAFSGWDEESRDGVTDACAYRRLMSSGSALAKAEIARAEQMAGRSVDRRVVAVGVHSHDGGYSWHGKG